MKLAEVIRRAIELGEGNGTVTFDQLNELIPSNLEPEDPEDIEAGSLGSEREGYPARRIMTPSPLAARSNGPAFDLCLINAAFAVEMYDSSHATREEPAPANVS
jgi:hypothetical protein